MRQNKRFFAVLLTFVMMFTALIDLGVAADGPTNLLKNGGFEEPVGGWPNSWNHCCGSGDPHSAIETETVRTGQRAVRIQTEESVLPYTYQTVYGIIPGATYEVSAWVNTHVTNGGSGAFFKVECYGASGMFLDFSNDNRVADSGNAFSEMVYRFTVPEGCSYINILCRLNGVGYVIFDDVALYKISEPPKFTFDFGDVFHYSNEEKGYAWVNLASAYRGQAVESEAKVDFCIKDGSRILHEQKDVSFTDGKVTYAYDISVLTRKKKRYTVCATVKWNGEEESFSQNIYVYDRPSIIGADGVIRINGEVFNPVMGYHIKDFTWDTVAESGINVVQFGSAGTSESNLQECDRILDILDQNGMKALFVLYKNMKPAAHPDNIEFTKTYVERFKNDPRIYAWAVMDEPFSANDEPDMRKLMEDSYALVRNIDSMHPVHITDVRTLSAKYCDIYSLDFYPSVMGDNQGVYEYLSERFSEIQGECFTQYIGKTFVYTKDPKDLPSVKNIRGYMHRAFETGIQGIGYFSISDAVSYQDPATNKTVDIPLYDLEYEDGFSWKGFSDFNKKELPVLYDVYVHNKYKPFNESAGGMGIRSAYWATWTDGNTVILSVHNKTAQTKTITPSTRSANGLIPIGGGTIEKIGGTAATPASTSDLSVTLEPFDVALYKITPSTPLDLTRLDKTNLFPVPDFDQASGANGWLGTGVATQAGGADGSANCLAIVPGQNAYYKDIAVDDVTSYTLSFKYKATGAAAAGVSIDTFNATGGNVGAFGLELSDTTDSTGVWKEKKIQFTTPQNASKFKISIRNNSADTTLCLDSFVLYADDDTPNFILNGSCEERNGNGKMDAWKPHDRDVTYTEGVGYKTGSNTLYWAQEAASGNHYLKLTVGTAGTNYSDVLLPMMTGGLPAGNYKLSFRAKMDTLSLNPSLRFYNTVIPNVPRESIAIAGGNIKANAWQEFTYRFTLTETTNIEAWLMYFLTATGTICFDDFVLTPDTSSADLCAGVKAGEGDTGGECVLPAATLSGIAEEADGTRRVSARVHHVPETNNAESLTVMTCIYKHEDGVKKLERISVKTEDNITAPKTITDTVVVPKIESGEVYTVESFVWNMLQDMKPLRGAAVLAN